MNIISDPMSDNMSDNQALKVGIFPYYVIRHGVTILLFGSLIITVHHINNVIHVHDEPST